VPRYNVDVQKSRGGIYWTNRYQLERNEPGLTPAEVAAFRSAEGPIHATTVQFVSLRISDAVPGTDNFAVYPLTGTGGTPDGGTPLPGFCCLRVDIPVGFGRPCRKYYRVYVGEAQSNGQTWIPEYVADTQALMNTLQSTVAGLVDPQGNPWGVPVVKTVIQMRQLRRGSKRQTTPVIPVS
jgi:hypothetical protein